MAIKDKNLDGIDGDLSIEQILEMLQTLEPQLMYDHDIERCCETTVRHLVHVHVPATAGDLKKFRSDLIEVGDRLENIVKRSENCEQIILVSLQILYKLIVSTGELCFVCWTFKLDFREPNNERRLSY